jgi:CRISPR-associated protein Cas1
MTDDKIIDISESAVGLSIQLANLVIKSDKGKEAMLPLPEVAALVLSNPHLTVSNAVLSGVAAAGGIVVVSDSKHQPAGMLLPLDAHCTQGERFRQQIEAPQPTQKRIWQQIVASKVKCQAAVLKRLTNSDHGLLVLAQKVASGDAGNIEAQAAQRYWPVVFNNPHFRRDIEADDHNRFLNYGYAILRALTARAICAAGLHPALGVHHHNRYDPFALASDLMEPFRPLVDETVAHHVAEHGEDATLGKETKRKLIEGLLRPIIVENEVRTLFSVLARTASSLAGIYGGGRKTLYLPTW